MTVVVNRAVETTNAAIPRHVGSEEMLYAMTRQKTAVEIANSPTPRRSVAPVLASVIRKNDVQATLPTAPKTRPKTTVQTAGMAFDVRPASAPAETNSVRPSWGVIPKAMIPMPATIATVCLVVRLLNSDAGSAMVYNRTSWMARPVVLGANVQMVAALAPPSVTK